MIQKKHYSKLPLLLLLCITLALALCSCSGTKSRMGSREEITEAMSAALAADDVLDYGYVSDYLQDWGFGNYDTSKVKYMERLVSMYYNYEGGMPQTREHARLCAEGFLTDYYDSIDRADKSTVTDAILTCYVNVLDDPYAIYRPAEESEEYNLDMSGKFGGIGVVIEYNHDEQSLMISSVYLGSPAEAAGMQVGDYIIGVDGVSIDEIGYLNVVSRVRGQIGTEVKLTLKRGDQTVECTAIRAEVVEKTVAYSVSDGVGYIQITDFKGNTYSQFVEAVKAVEAAEVKGVIFDLRGNLGGYLDTVCDMISYLVPTGHRLVSYAYKNMPEEITKTSDDVDPVSGKISDHVLDLPMVVLCNEYTASAGEIFTAAIRDYRNDGLLNATVVGTTTFKKGVMQKGFLYSDGSSITFTVAYYAPPCGINYHGVGVTPDVQIQNTETEDLQLERALEELDKLINAN